VNAANAMFKQVRPVETVYELGKRAVGLGLLNAPLQMPGQLIPDVSFAGYRDDARSWNAVRHLEANFEAIRDEVVAVYETGAIARTASLDDAGLHIAGEWKELDFIKRGMVQQRAVELLPITSRIVMGLADGNSMVHGGSKISLMRPGTVVRPHTGSTNARLRIHMGIQIPPKGVYLRVDNETRTWTEGKCTVIDDSYVHEVWHHADTTRIVLIVDVWHPDMDEEQRRESIQGGQIFLDMYEHHKNNPRMALQMLGVPEHILPNQFVYG